MANRFRRTKWTDFSAERGMPDNPLDSYSENHDSRILSAVLGKWQQLLLVKKLVEFDRAVSILLGHSFAAKTIL